MKHSPIYGGTPKKKQLPKSTGFGLILSKTRFCFKYKKRKAENDSAFLVYQLPGGGGGGGVGGLGGRLPVSPPVSPSPASCALAVAI
jgi:hypothetical protein